LRILYGIASCDSCRKARKWLDAESIEYDYHDIRIDGLAIQMLERWSGRIDWQKMLNKRSLTWRKIPEMDRRELTKDKALTLMMQHQTLVKRPILECDGFIALGFSPENYKMIFADDK
jgi:arsenate reductase